MIGVEKVLDNEEPNVILVEGDTNTVVGGALVAAKLHKKLGHVEAPPPGAETLECLKRLTGL